MKFDLNLSVKRFSTEVWTGILGRLIDTVGIKFVFWAKKQSHDREANDIRSLKKVIRSFAFGDITRVARRPILNDSEAK